ncbi:helix-turn-helix domain-containing protein [Nonomuraea sp. NPDC005501]|uniref:helix-turn-helix domain-containing protein n=1 Tax=Nonomuraea sp. NPDC005501 TaxID=3156884 RepID=UPI00339EAC3B
MLAAARGWSVTQIARELGVGRFTLYRALEDDDRDKSRRPRARAREALRMARWTEAGDCHNRPPSTEDVSSDRPDNNALRRRRAESMR